VNTLEEGELVEVKVNVEQADVTEFLQEIEWVDVVSESVPNVPVNV